MEPEPHDMVTCPYNKAHQVEHYRLHVHLQKCRKNYPQCKKVSCPMDATHIVNDVELDFHVKHQCTKRILFDSQVYVTEDEAPGPAVIPPPAVHSDENWDDEHVEMYKPVPKNHIITKPRGLKPAERREHRRNAVKNYKPPEAQQ